MEDFVNKRNYLNHLKQISAIKNGHCKSGITLKKSRLSSMNINLLRDNLSNINNTLSKFSTNKKMNSSLTTRAKSTQQIMKNFCIQKQNLRLVQRIGTMSSQINMRKYQKQYIDNKKLMKFHSKVRKPKQFFKFKIFDIKFQGQLIDPQQTFNLFEISKNKKRFITKGNIFQLRKQEIKTTKDQVHLVKIEGKNWGIVELTDKCFLPIKQNKQEVGNLVIDII